MPSMVRHAFGHGTPMPRMMSHVESVLDGDIISWLGGAIPQRLHDTDVVRSTSCGRSRSNTIGLGVSISLSTCSDNIFRFLPHKTKTTHRNSHHFTLGLPFALHCLPKFQLKRTQGTRIVYLVHLKVWCRMLLASRCQGESYEIPGGASERYLRKTMATDSKGSRITTRVHLR